MTIASHGKRALKIACVVAGALVAVARARARPGHGMEDYASVLPELSERYHVFAVDCFGHGESVHNPALYTCSKNGDALIAFAGQVIGGDYIVSGHSSGGILAATCLHERMM